MKRAIYITILFVFLLSGAFSQEVVLRNNGYSDLSVDGKEITRCAIYNFTIEENALKSQKSPIFSVNASFTPVLEDSVKITLNFNNSGEITIWGNQFSCNEECWAREIISKSKLSAENTLEICATTTNITERVIVFADSFLEFYETPIFTLDNISPGTVFLGERAEMRIIAKNLGSKDANVFIQFIDPIGKKVINLDSFFVVEGESTARTTMRAGETKTFTYYIRPTLESSYNLPSAVLTFTNIFGEEQNVYSQHPLLFVVKPERTEAFIAGSNPVDNIFEFKIIVRNKWSAPFKGQLRVSHEDHVEGAFSEIIIPANSEKEFSFKTNELSSGDYNFYAIIEDENSLSVSNSVTFRISSETIPEEIYFALTGIIVSVLLFISIFLFWKESHD